MSLLRRVIGGVLRRVRLRQGRTLREVAAAAGVSLPYLSEVERGRKEASSEVLAAICRALGINLSDLLEEARDELRRVERRVPVPPGGSLARLDRVPTARQGRTGPGMTTVGRAGPWGTTVGRAGPWGTTVGGAGPWGTTVGGAGTATVGGAGTGMTTEGGTGMTTVGGFGFGFGTTTVGVSVRVVAVVSTARPAARTARVPGRRRVGTGRRRLLVG
ncbi:helix-turn-helix domain-containing protein [Micromonospora sp. RL09-050-HVF-A]|uniref:helix-turn-helix domain-containing protein n=1 Tax=Micromonospora sp. RL09-050-HVF-A TaxID=1703433 RepID=UPI001C6001E7|nr:helix-turn-helix transcriptional regulator [Micromonospora sp. RL09-050-HVF-A]MBW4704692.1 helix-turn-helix transcriptional regulator [Micromonospora sp. RL09-050-HVF-A]